MHNNHLPKVSVVTVTLNAVKYIEKTILSVVMQTYSNIEYIVIDGGSTDGTLEIIKQYDQFIDIWKSEVDNGLFDAMNKAFNLASGDYVNFLNAGDVFFSPKTIEELPFLDMRKPFKSICGKNLFVSNYTKYIIETKPSSSKLPHQALFMARKDFDKFHFNTMFKYCADSELWTRFIPEDHDILFINDYISVSSFGGISTSSKYLIDRFRENLQFRKNKVSVLTRFFLKLIAYVFLGDKGYEVVYFFFRGRKIKFIDKIYNFDLIRR